MLLLLFLFWLILNGRITIEIILVGAAVSVALTWIARRFLHVSPQAELRLLRCLPGVIYYLFYLVIQIIISNLQVMRIILSPGKPSPKLVWFQPKLESEIARLTLANSITLTPGTVTASLDEETICVYALQSDFAVGLSDSGFVEKLHRLEGESHG